jgi:hypothetical protein
VIAAVSLLLITDLRVAIFVFLCVALTLLGKQSFSLKILVDIYSYSKIILALIIFWRIFKLDERFSAV